MQAQLECIICQQRQAVRILQLTALEPQVQETALRQVLTYMANVPWNTDPMTITRGMYELLHQITHNPDPYHALKQQSNQDVLAIYPELQRLIQENADPLLTACKFAVAGNIIDFGAHDHFNVHDTIQRVLATDFAINTYDRFKASLQHAASLVLFADNAGEIVCDKLLLETIQHVYPLQKITVVVKARPIINDATLTDAQQIGLTELPNCEVRQLHTPGLTSSFWNLPEIQSWMQAHDLVISKGQANYEGLGSLPGVYFLLIAKCAVVAQLTGTYKDALIFKYTE
jgi:damage-control phosphatase, subfamily I